MFWWNKKKETGPKDKWDMTVGEAIEKYGSAKAALDAFVTDTEETTVKVFDPFVSLLLIERKEKLDFEKSIKDGK